MKFLEFIVATTIFCQIVASPSIRRSRGFIDRSPVNRNPEHTIIINANENPFFQPPWLQGPNEDLKPKPNGPHGPYNTFEISHGGFVDSSSEEDNDMRRPTGPTRNPGYGVISWWRPLPSSTTPKNIPTRPSNPTENILEQIKICVRSCPVTAEYNPVCGSNNVTYANLGRLECEQKCGIDVQLSRLTACSVPPINQPVNPSSEGIAACVRNCPVTTEYSPVCGSNNVTYVNHGRLLCDQYCGIPVELSKLSPCPSSQEPTPRPLNSEEVLSCIRLCLATGEYNPVCGSNNITYTNFGQLECAQNCGVAVTISKLGSCGVPEPTTTQNTVPFEGFAAICMSSCPVTTEYNPICGSNNVTYTNLGRLECAQNCGVAVSLARHTPCDATLTEGDNKNNEINFIPTINSTTPRPYINSNGNIINVGNNEIKNKNESLENNLNKENNSVNQSGDNWNNVNHNKENACNKNGGCKGENNSSGENNQNNQLNGNNDNGGQTIVGDNEDKTNIKGRPSSPGYGGNNFPGGNGENNENYGNNNCKGVNNREPPSIKEVMACMQTCSLTSESNPVCGTDSVTYMNPGRLLCAQFCGVDVRVKKFAPCGSTTTTNIHCLTTCTNPPVTDNPAPVTPPIPSLEACMEACPASVEFRPVCGSNNVTYRNIEKLQCAIRCGIAVSLKRNTHCFAHEIELNSKDGETQFVECMQQCSAPQKYEPMCGSNNVTYNNTGHLVCARQCGLNVEVKQLHACSTAHVVSPIPTSSTTDKTPVVTPSPNGLNFTIDPAILASIWGPSTPNGDDEDFELDQRVQDRS